MAYQLWALDREAGQACIIKHGNVPGDEQWYMVSPDSDWNPIQLTDAADAMRWALTVPVSVQGTSYPSLEELIVSIRSEYLTTRQRFGMPASPSTAARLWPADFFDPSDKWTIHDRNKEFFWAYWLEHASRVQSPLFSERIGLGHRAHAAFATHIILCHIWRPLHGTIQSISDYPIGSTWWSQVDRERLVAWYLASFLQVVLEWMQESNHSERTTYQLRRSWARLDTALVNGLLPTIEKLSPDADPTKESARTALERACATISAKEPLFASSARIIASHAEEFGVSKDIWARSILNDRAKAVNLLRTLYATVGSRTADRMIVISRLNGDPNAGLGLGRPDRSDYPNLWLQDSPVVPPPPPSPPWGGTARFVSTTRLNNIIEMIMLSQQSGILRAIRGQESARQIGQIRFVNGHPATVVLGQMVGENALNDLKEWRDCTYSFDEGVFDQNVFGTIDSDAAGPADPYGPSGFRPFAYTPPPPSVFGYGTLASHGNGLGKDSDEAAPAQNLLEAVPYQTGISEPIEQLPLDRRERMILLLINGQRSMLDLVHLTHRTESEIYAVLQHLALLGLIQFRR